MNKSWSLENDDMSALYAGLIQLNPDTLEAKSGELASLAQKIANSMQELNQIKATAQLFWNEGVGTDVESYGKSLTDVINYTETNIVSLLNEYSKTMNILASAVRTVSQQSINIEKV